ncbi:MAG: hypothetical protein DSY37_04600 [Hyperthermus sp.]|nr:MAG: hypothetical protein DSY37_04600 [Hyperthermus sp.]
MALVNLSIEDQGQAAEESSDLLSLLHAIWIQWPLARHKVYRLLGVRSTEELIRKIVDINECRVRDDELAEFIEALSNTVQETMVEDARKQLGKLIDGGVWITPFTSRLYPCELLRYPARGDHLYPPLVLYWIGARINTNEKPAIAVVGTRRCSSRGRRLAREIGRMLAKHGLILVTGLAECIDTEAARGALEEGGVVIGVRPWLKPLSLPQEAKQLLRYLHSGLAVTSENPLKPARGSVKRLYFLRNRIIAGMAKLVIVVEAQPTGGSMHQIELALKRGKPVAIYKPKPNTPHYKAYENYLSKGAKSFKTLDELEKIMLDYVRF